MKLDKVREILEAEVILKGNLSDKEIVMACGSDLMSDVLTFVKPDALLLTGLTNPQVVRTAEIAEIIAICFVRGKKPQDDTIKLARGKGIPLLATRFSMYVSSGRLYKNGLPGWDDLK